MAEQLKFGLDAQVAEAIDRARYSSQLSLRGLTALQKFPKIPRIELLRHVRAVDLSFTAIEGYEALAEAFPLLERLYISGTTFENFKYLSRLRNLTVLDASYTQLKRLHGIEHLSRLISLNVSNTNLRSLVQISALTNLRSLDASHSLVSDLGQFVPSTLRHLDLTKTQIGSLPDTRNLRKLTALSIADTAVHDLKPLSSLRSLTKLNLNASRVEDLRPIAECVSLVRSAERNRKQREEAGISFRGCPLTDEILVAYAPLPNPSRTVETFRHLRSQLGLPPFEVVPERGPHQQAVLWSPPELPKQGSGPHFQISETGAIEFSAPAPLDKFGNNIQRLEQLHPILREAAIALAGVVAQVSNQHPELSRVAMQYRTLVDNDLANIPFGQIFGVGLRLENAFDAMQRKVVGRLAPELEDDAHEVLRSVIALHGPFILATKEGQDLIADSERYQEEKGIAEFKDALLYVAKSLRERSDLATPEASEFLEASAATLDTTSKKQTTFALGTAHNLLVVLLAGSVVFAAPVVGAALLGPVGGVGGAAVSILSIEALKKTNAFERLRTQASSRLDDFISASFSRFASFALEHEKLLRRLAGERQRFKWLHASLDWLKKTAEDRSDQ
jgi:hypothetical protein